MDDPVTHYWHLRLTAVQKALEANNFEAHVVENAAQAQALVLDTILPATKARSVSWGGSMTLTATGIRDALLEHAELEIIDTFDKTVTPEESLERRRQALLSDLFLTGANAVTESGMLVNLDMIGNRVGAITFGPRTVVILAGRNKIVADLDQAVSRIKSFSAPANVMRLNKKTPCFKTGECADCASPERICNVWTIQEKSFPAGRIKVVLINEDMGL
jgi:L-lactate utilization protein LutB